MGNIIEMFFFFNLIGRDSVIIIWDLISGILDRIPRTVLIQDIHSFTLKDTDEEENKFI